MKMIRLAFINYKRQLKSKGNIMMMILPLVIIFGMHFMGSSNKGGSGPKIALCINDRGSYGVELSKSIDNPVIENDEKKAINLLENNEVLAIYVVGQDFSENIREGVKPNIKSYKLQKGNGTDATELAINEFIREKMKENLLLREGAIESSKDLENKALKVNVEYNKGIFGDSKMVLFMLFYFVLMGSGSISEELITLRKQKILKRAATTANKGYEIIGSVYLSLFFIQITYFIADLIIAGAVMNVGINEFILGAIIIAILSLVSISLALVATRICENTAMVNFALIMINIGGLFLSMFTQIPQEVMNIPKYVLNIAKFTPQYWAIDILDKGTIFPGVLVLILMIIALFTCGNIRSNDYLIK